MTNNRRQFLKAAGALTLGVWMSPLISSCSSSEKKLGLQLWTIKEDMASDPKGALKKVAEAGYKQIESFQGEKGMFFGMQPKEFKSYLDDLGMTIVSSHANTNENFQQTVDDAASIGMKYLLNPYSKKESIEEYKQVAENFNRLGEMCQKAGMKFGYHNHDYAFYEMSGQVPYDLLLQQTDPDKVVMEMDLYWVVKAGKDPVTYFEKYPGRFPMVHVKDMAKTGDKPSTEVGNGSIDFAQIFNHAKKAGIEYYFVEQEQFERPPLESIKISYQKAADLI